MRYDLHITGSAENDINEAADYIEYVLKNPQAADNLLDAIEETLPTLKENPQRFAIVSDPVLNAWGIRFVQINNYLAFYAVDDNARKVNVIRFLYMKRDWIGILRQGYTVDRFSNEQ